MLEDQKNPEEQIKELEAKCQEYLAGWKRAMADYENLRKDNAREQQEAAEFAQARLLLQIFPLYDYFKLAIGHIPLDQQKAEWVKGIIHIHKAFRDFLKNSEVEEINTDSAKFDPEKHEAVGEEESNLPDGTITKEVRAGYEFKGKVIVPAQVMVAKHQAAQK